MSSDAVSWAFDQPDLTKSEVLVAVAIAEWANPSGVAFPGQESVAKRCKCGVDTIVKLMMALDKKGTIGRAERRRENGRRTSDWIVLGPRQTAEERRPMKPASTQEDYPEIVLALFEPVVADKASHGETPSDDPPTSLRVSPPDHFGFSPDFTSGSEVPLKEEENHQKEPSEENHPPFAPPMGGQPNGLTEGEWERFLERLAQIVDTPTFNLWLADLQPVAGGDELVIAAPEQKVRWVAGRFGNVFSQAAGKPVRIVLPNGETPAPASRDAGGRQPSRRRRRRAA